MTVRKIRAGRVTTVTMDQFVGDVGTLFYNESTGEMRVSNGVDPGGNVVSYVLPIASNVILGGIKLGTGFAIDANGVASVTGGGIGSVGPQGPAGEPGPQGPAGEPGTSANLIVYDNGTLVTGNAESINFIGASITSMGSDVTVTITGNNVLSSSDRLVSGNAEVVLNTSGPEPYLLFPAASTGEQLQLAQAEISSVSGNLALTSAEDALIIANGSGAVPGGSRLWRFDRTGGITLPNNAIIKDSNTNSISFGLRAGDSGQGTLTVAIGSQAGEINQGLQSTAVGSGAGNYNQGIGTVAIGTNAGAFNQGLRAVAIGGLAGSQNQGEYAVALGNFAGGTNQPNNSIIINASGTALNGSASGLFIDPVREVVGTKIVYYNSSTKEITTGPIGLTSNSNVSITSNNNVWTFGTDGSMTTPGLLKTGNIQVGRNIYGSALGGISNAIQLRPDIDIDKRFLFTVDSSGGNYIRSGMEMPMAEVDKAVTLAFPHDNSTAGYIFNQGTDTNGTEWNDALVIFQNGGNVKIGTITNINGTKIWTFGTDGGLRTPDNQLTIGGYTIQASNNNEIDLSNGSNIVITSNVGSVSITAAQSEWLFQTSGNLTLPQGSLKPDATDGFLTVEGPLFADMVPSEPGSPSYNTISNGVKIRTHRVGDDSNHDWNFAWDGAIYAPRDASNYQVGAIEWRIDNISSQIRRTEGGTLPSGRVIPPGLMLFSNMTGAVSVQTGNSKYWTFEADGHLTLPNSAVIKDTATNSIAFGGGAGATAQGHSAVSLGEGAGNNTQGNQAVALGRGSGNYFQGNGAIGIGFCAGATDQGDYAIAIGFKAARGNMDNDGTPNQPANSIMINASSTPLNGNQAGLYINPIREDTGNIAKVVYYNISTKELTYADPAGGGGAGLPLVNGTSNFDIATENGNATITANGITWTFDTDGLLQVPDYTGNIGGVIGDNYADGGLTIKANSTLTGYVELTNNDETAGVYVQNDATAGQVRIYTANGDWNFNADGSLTLNGGGVSLGNGSLTGVKGIDRRASFNTLTAGVMTISNNERNAYIGNPTGNEITSNFTVNLTNFVLEAYYETSVKIKISQHTTGYYPNVLQINGVTQTIRWEGGSSPTPGSNTVDLVEFDIQNTNSGGGAYLVLGRFVGGKNTGNLTFPDGTIQSTAWTGSGGSASTVDITDTNGLTTTYYPTFVESRTNGQYMRADVDLTYRTDTNTLTAGNMATGVLKIEDGVHEKFQTKSNAIGTVTHDCSSGHIFYHTLPSANWTVNLTNLNLAVGYATAITLVIEQGATGYYPSAVQIDGNAVPLAWQGNTIPTPSSNRFDVVTFSILYDGLYTVLGQLTGF